VISSARAALRDEIFEAHTVMVDLMAYQIDEYIAGIELDVSDLAARPEVARAFETQDSAGLSAQFAQWLGSRHGKVDGIGARSTDGTFMATARPRPSTPDQATIDTVNQVIITGEIARGVPRHAPVPGNAIAPSFAPVRSSS